MMTSCHCLKIVEKEVEIRREKNKAPELDRPTSPQHTMPPLKPVAPDRVGRAVVDLYKPDHCNLGLTVSETGDVPAIATIRPGSIADRSDCLLLNDRVLRINGISTSSLRHEEIVRLVKSSGPRIIFEIEYELPEMPSHNYRYTTTKRTQVTLERDGESFGFTVRGGHCKDPARVRPLTVMHVRPGSSAERDGRVKAGDRILSINGASAETLTCDEAVRLMRNAEFELHLFVEYNVAVVDSTRQPGMGIIVEIDKLPSERLGISLAPYLDHRDVNIFYIDNIREGSIADRCGALQVGDKVYAIDDMKVDHMTLQEALHRLKSNVSDRIRLEIVPRDTYDSQITSNHRDYISRPKSLPGRVNSVGYLSSVGAHASEHASRGTKHRTPEPGLLHDQGSSPSSTSPRTMSRCSCHNSGPNPGLSTSPYPISSALMEPMSVECMNSNALPLPPAPGEGNNGSRGSRAPTPIIITSSSLTPTFNNSEDSSKDPDKAIPNTSTSEANTFQDDTDAPPKQSRTPDARRVRRQTSMDRKIKRQASLDRSNATLAGVGEERESPTMGNYIHSSRSTPTSSLRIKSSLSTSTNSLHVSSQNPTVCRMEEINVILNVDEMGSFGFTLMGNNQGPSIPLSEYPVIEYVQPGGSAYQSNVIQENDRVLAINGESTIRRSLDELNSQIIESGASLELTLQFDIADAVVPTSGVFSVKLVKRFESIGINLQAPASRRKGDPLVISKVVTGSVANRSGSIQVGDLLLAVDGVSVDCLSLAEAVQLLHEAEELVTLRIHKEEPTSTVSEEFESQLLIRVELTRSSVNQPWGIVVSGVDDTPTGPIFVDSLTPEGPGEACGRLHPGDQILAINGQSVNGRTLSQAMTMLQQFPDRVVIKVARYRTPQTEVPKSGHHYSYHNSVSNLGPSSTTGTVAIKPTSHNRKMSVKAFANQTNFNKSFDSAIKVETTPRLPDNVSLQDAAMVPQKKSSLSLSHLHRHHYSQQSYTQPSTDLPSAAFSNIRHIPDAPSWTSETPGNTNVNPSTNSPYVLTANSSQIPYSRNPHTSKTPPQHYPNHPHHYIPGSRQPQDQYFHSNMSHHNSHHPHHHGNQLQQLQQKIPSTDSAVDLPDPPATESDSDSHLSHQHHSQSLAMMTQANSAFEPRTSRMRRFTDGAPSTSAGVGIDEVPEDDAPGGFSTDQSRGGPGHTSKSQSNLYTSGRRTPGGGVQMMDNGGSTETDGAGGRQSMAQVQYSTVPLDQIHCPGCREAIENELRQCRTQVTDGSQEGPHSRGGSRTPGPRPSSGGDTKPRRQASADSRIIRSRTPTSGPGYNDPVPDHARSKLSLSNNTSAWVHRTDSGDSAEIMLTGPKGIMSRDQNPRHTNPSDHNSRGGLAAMAMTRRFWVRLVKASDSESFGIGVSHGQSPKGVVITAIRPKSPAATSGQISLYDRILKVNDIATDGMNCAEVVSLISRSGKVLDLFIQRRKTAHTYLTGSTGQGQPTQNHNSVQHQHSKNHQQQSSQDPPANHPIIIEATSSSKHRDRHHNQGHQHQRASKGQSDQQHVQRVTPSQHFSDNNVIYATTGAKL